MEHIFTRLKELHSETPVTPSLPSEEEIKDKENKYGINFPPSYKLYLLKFSNLNVGTFEPYMLNRHQFPYIDLDSNVEDARKYGLPDHLFPFMTHNGDYFCFNLNSEGPEYEVLFWSHDFPEEKWKNFMDWVENCWIKEA